MLMLEKAPREWIGGNTWFTAGAFRLNHAGLEDLDSLLERPDGTIDLPPYTPENYRADMRRVTGDKCDPQLTDILVHEARDAADWMSRQGIRWRLMSERQAHESGGHLRFWGGLAVGAAGGGEAMIEAYLRAAADAGIPLRTDSPVTGLMVRHGAVVGVRVGTRRNADRGDPGVRRRARQRRLRGESRTCGRRISDPTGSERTSVERRTTRAS